MSPAGKKYRVNAQSREGFIDRRRAGHAWPRGAGNYREVLIVDTEEDPPGNLVDGHFAVGQKTLRALEADPEIYLNDSATATDPSAVEAENAALKARITELEGLLATATDPSAKAKGDRGK